MIKQGLLDKHGKPTDSTPAAWTQDYVDYRWGRLAARGAAWAVGGAACSAHHGGHLARGALQVLPLATLVWEGLGPTPHAVTPFESGPRDAGWQPATSGQPLSAHGLWCHLLQ